MLNLEWGRGSLGGGLLKYVTQKVRKFQNHVLKNTKPYIAWILYIKLCFVSLIMNGKRTHSHTHTPSVQKVICCVLLPSEQEKTVNYAIFLCLTTNVGYYLIDHCIFVVGALHADWTCLDVCARLCVQQLLAFLCVRGCAASIFSVVCSRVPAKID